MKKLFGVVVLLLCESVFALSYPVGELSIRPTTSFSSGNGYIITQKFMYISDDGVHLGIDLATSGNASGGDIRSIAAGTVVATQNSQVAKGWGTMVRIRHQLPDGTVYYSQYAHMLYNSVTVTTNVVVNEGQVIGKVGSTGYSTKPHLHLEVKIKNSSGCGYLPNPKCPSDSTGDYFDPLEFIAQHQSQTQSTSGYWENGQKQDAIFTKVQELNGPGYDLGLEPYDNGGGLYVHDWYSSDGSAFVTIQDFKDKYGNIVAIIYNPELDQAFLLQGGIRSYYMNLAGDGPKIFGPPICDEFPFSYYQFINGAFQKDTVTYPVVEWQRQDFKNDNFIIFRSDMGSHERGYSESGGGFTIAVLPGDGVNLNLQFCSTSPNQMFVNHSLIEGAQSYEFYLNGIFYDYVSGGSYVVNDLQPNTAYTAQVKAIDGSGNILAESATLTATTLPLEEVAGLALTVNGYSTYADISWPPVSNSSYAEVYRNSELVKTVSTPFASVFELASGQTYTFLVKVFNANGNLLASGSKTYVTGQNAYLRTEADVSELGPNQTVHVKVYGVNGTSGNMTNFQYNIVDVLPAGFIASPANATPLVSSIPAGQTMLLYEFDVATANYYPLSSSASIAVFAQFDAPVPGLTTVQRSGILRLPIAKFSDMIARFDSQQSTGIYGQNPSVTLAFENYSNTDEVSQHFELYLVDQGQWQFLGSGITPYLKARDIWTTEFPLGSLPAGDYQFKLVVDPLNQLTELDELNNEDQINYRIFPQQVADLHLEYAIVYPVTADRLRVGEAALVEMKVSNPQTAASVPTEVEVVVGSQSKRVNLRPLEPNEEFIVYEYFILVQEGLQSVSVNVDVGNLMDEPNEADNQITTSIDVWHAYRPEVTINITPTKSNFKPSEDIVYQVTVSNSSPAVCPSVRVDVYDVNYTLVASFITGNIISSYQQTVNLGQFAEGQPYIEAHVDYDNLVAEEDDNNNWDYARVSVANDDFNTLIVWLTEVLEISSYDTSNIANSDEVAKINYRPSISREGWLVGRGDFSSIQTGSYIVSAEYLAYLAGVSEIIDSNFVLSVEPQPYDYASAWWNERMPRQSWSGVLETGQSVTFVPSTVAAGNWLELDATNLIQAVVDGLIQNQGIVLSQEYNSLFTGNQTYWLATEDNAGARLRPYIVIKYANEEPVEPVDPLVSDPITIVIPLTDMITLSSFESVSYSDTSLKFVHNASYGRQGHGMARADIVAFVPSGAQVLDAKYLIWLTGWSEVHNSNFILSLESQPYDHMYANWSQRLPGQGWSGILETGKSVTLVQQYSLIIGSWLELDATNLVQVVVDGLLQNEGIRLSQQDSSLFNGNQEYYLATDDYPDITKRPYMVITYLPNGQ